ncbi:hypothetical protein D3C85_1411010 [compost metagenome]
MLDVQHSQYYQKKHDVDEDEFEVRVVIHAQQLMDRYPPLLRLPSELNPHKCRCRHRQAVGATGEGQPVVEHQSNDFSEAQGHDGQIVAMQSQHRKTQQATRKTSSNSGKR